MAEYFDSPRASKRRKTTTYGADRSILRESKDDDRPIQTPTRATGSLRSKKQGDTAKLNVVNGLIDNEPIEDEDVSIIGLRRSTTHNAHVQISDDAAATIKVGRGTKQSSRGGTLSSTTMSPSIEESIPHNPTEDVVETSADAVNPGRQDTPPIMLAESEEDMVEECTTAIHPRSSGRERKRPRRFSNSPEKQKTEIVVTKEPSSKHKKTVGSSKKDITSMPKGILTPSRKEKRGPRKSVVFDRSDKDLEEQLGFRDIDSSVKTSAKKATGVVSDSPSRKIIHKTKKASPTRTLEERSLDDISIAENGETADHEDELLVDHFAENIQTNPANQIAEPEQHGLQLVEDEDPFTLSIKSTILTRLVTPPSISATHTTVIPSHLQAQYTTVYDLLTATITAGESNSLLLLGSRGSGKSHLLMHALSSLTAKHGSDFHTVRLNGYFQTDDKLALREIWRQLGREMNTTDDDETDNKDGAPSSYADTMASLLSLLSHPDDFLPTTEAEEQEENQPRQDPTAKIASRSVIFVLDEFDLFTTHPRQTLLYNLFDIAQSRKAPIAVIGCSTRMDVVDCLEKRVKSRFSHRWVHVPGVKSLDGFQDIVRDLLCLTSHESEHEEEAQVWKKWNDFIQSTFLSSGAVQGLIRQVFYSTRSIPDLLTALYVPIATLRLPAAGSDAGAVESAINSTPLAPPLPQPSPLDLLSSIPTLHLALLIAAARLDIIHSLSAVNFNLVHSHYAELVTRSKLQQTASGAVAVGAGLRQWKRETARAAWEDLGSWAFVIPVSSGIKESGGEVTGGEGASVRMWRVDVTLDDLSWAVKEKWAQGGSVFEVLRKWCKEV